MAKKARKLDLARLRRGLSPGVTPSVGRAAAEAASIVFEHNAHRSGVAMEVVSGAVHQFVVEWPQIHQNAGRAHADLPAAAEQGAYGVAWLLALEFTEYRVIERSYKGTGFDYWLGHRRGLLFQQAARMEVSAIINDASEVNARVTAKKKQTDKSAGTLPAFVAVIEFGQPKSVFVPR